MNNIIVSLGHGCFIDISKEKPYDKLARTSKCVIFGHLELMQVHIFRHFTLMLVALFTR
jgi:hypothetical protein